MNYNVDPMNLIMQIKAGKNPQQLMMDILQTGAADNPVVNNLLSLAKENRTADIENFARNLAKEQGIDFDKEFSLFKKKYFGR
jgi:hypothetical protein